MPDLEDIKQRLNDKWWRLNNLYWIITDEGEPTLFQCNPPQQKLFNELWWRDLILKARQLGFTTFIDLWILDECLFTPNLEAAIIAHRKDDATKIFRRKIQYPFENLLPAIRDKRKPLLKDSQEEYRFANNSAIAVTTSARSGSLQLLHISEYGKICSKYPEKAREIKTGSIPAVGRNGVTFIESTAEGRSGDFYEKSQEAKRVQEQGEKLTRLDFKFFFYPWFEHPHYWLDASDLTITQGFQEYFEQVERETGVTLTPEQKAWYIKEYKVYGDDMLREYPSTSEEAFRQAIHGTYFARELSKARKDGRITKIPVEDALQVHTFWDLGLNDAMAIWFVQIIGREVRVIDYYENSGEGLPHYVKVLRDKEYLYGKHLAPHDIQVRELTDGRSRIEKARELGINFETVPRVEHKPDSIEAARDFISLCWFDEDRCELGLQRLENYRKEWDENKNRYKDHPLKDENTHGADAFQTGAWGQNHLFGVSKAKAKPVKRVPAGGWT